MKKKKQKRTWNWMVLLPLLFLVLGIGALAIPKRVQKLEQNKELVQEAPAANETQQTKSITFAGVGDNLLHDTLFLMYPSNDYRPYYARFKDIVENADLGYINFETVCAGEEFGLSGYPSFNGPTEFIDAMKDTGFDWYSASSNHSLDAGMDGLIAELNHLDSLGETWTGSHRSQEEADTPTVMDINGLKVGVAGFTYGLNGYQKPEGADWLVDVFMDGDTVDYALMEKYIDSLQDVSDVQMVAMHWGDEYSNTPNDIQKEVAQWLNSKGVEVIIGTHPHVIQPAEILHGENQDTLVYYSLGNFLSAQDQPERMVGGLAQFRLNYDPNTDTTTFEDVSFTPTVTWIQPDLTNYQVYPFYEWTDDLANNHWLPADGLTREAIAAYVSQVMGNPEGITINLN